MAPHGEAWSVVRVRALAVRSEIRRAGWLTDGIARPRPEKKHPPKYLKKWLARRDLNPRPLD